MRIHRLDGYVNDREKKIDFFFLKKQTLVCLLTHNSSVNFAWLISDINLKKESWFIVEYCISFSALRIIVFSEWVF